MLWAEGGRYILVGILNTAVGYGVFGACLWLGWPHQLSLLASYVIGGIHSYFWNRHWTFRALGQHRRQIPRFVGVTAMTYALNALLLELLARMGIVPLLAQLGCLGITTVVGFLLHRSWSFRAERGVPALSDPE